MARILIVDDEKSLRLTLREFLRNEGHAVQEAEDADAALQRLSEADFDLVVADILLPRVSGVELLRRIHATAPHVQVVMMTGEPTVETATDSLRAGAADYLFKPITKDAILRVVANAARLKTLEDTKRRLEAENHAHQENLEQLVDERTRALRQSEALYQSLVETLPQHVFRKDATGRFTFGNSLFCKSLGRPLPEILGKTDFDFFPAELAEKYQQDDRRVAETGQPFEGEEEFRRADGKTIWVNVIKTPVRDPVGKLAGTQGIFWDITARKEAEGELRLAHERLQHLVDSNVVGIIIATATGEVLEANDYYLRLIGFTREELKQRQVDWRCLTPPEWLPADEQAIREVRERGTSAAYEKEYLRRDGTRVSVLVADAVLPGPRGEQLVGFVLDLTERKQLETQLRHAQKMEAIGQLSSGIAHDFNNTLAVIRGNADLLLMEADDLTPESNEGLKQIIGACERAANLTRQLLIFSRKQVMQAQPLALNELVRNLTRMLKRTIRENVRLECLYADPLAFVQADPGMLEQVLLNLVVNARDAMPQGGRLQIATESIRLGPDAASANPERRAGDFVCLSVKDTGTGISPEHLPRIFEPFFTTKQPGQGTGLGLATVHGIAKQHAGWIEVCSRVGEGAAFKIFLPAIPPPANNVAAVPPAQPALRRGAETILLVEDEAAVRGTTRRVLESFGYKVREASCAREALQVWNQHADSIALLLTDLMMPEAITGWELARQLRAKRPGLKVMYMSGYSSDAASRGTEFFQRRQAHFLRKPCTADLLIRTVRQCLDEKP